MTPIPATTESKNKRVLLVITSKYEEEDGHKSSRLLPPNSFLLEIREDGEERKGDIDNSFRSIRNNLTGYQYRPFAAKKQGTKDCYCLIRSPLSF